MILWIRKHATFRLRITRRLQSSFGRLTTITTVMVQIFLVCTLLALSNEVWSASLCQSPRSTELAKVLNFNMPPAGTMPGGWNGGPPGTIFRDDQVVHKAQWAVRIERHPSSPSQFSTLTHCVHMDFTGKTIELRGFLRIENVTGFAGLWVREDGFEGPIAFDNMHSRYLHGTTGWTEYSITLPDKRQGRRLFFGVLLVGTGKAWASDLQLRVDGKPIWEAPRRELVKTVLDTDRPFDKGSGIAIQKLTRVQIDNLVTLGKVWGFLKYYDPIITSGRRQWDYDLFRVLPRVLAAPDRASANAVIVRWIDALGPVAPCNPCAHLDKNHLQLWPDLGWINDTHLLGKDLSQKLRWIRNNRRTGKQFYVALTPGGNAIFEHERSYRAIKFPDAGFQLLALYRFWNMVEYWYPDRNVIGEDWDQVLAKFIPRLALAKDRNSYALQLMALIAMIHDSHANLWSSEKLQPPAGRCHFPVQLSFIQNQPVVTRYMDGKKPSTSPLQIGDVITRLDGEPVSKDVKNWVPYYGASNEAARLRYIAVYMTRGPCGATTVGIRRDGRAMNLSVQRVPLGAHVLLVDTDDALPGPGFRLLSPQVAYLDPSAVPTSQIAADMRQAAGTKGLIIDLRNELVHAPIYALANSLVDRVTPAVRFTQGNLSNPGAFYWTPAFPLTPHTPHYAGKIVILVNAHTQSASEYAAMLFRAAPGAIVVGSTTAGADGNMSRIPLPGGLHTDISGIGVFYPDFRPTQRIGIVPNVVVKPTIADIRAGRDAMLDEALRLILGPKISIDSSSISPSGAT